MRTLFRRDRDGRFRSLVGHESKPGNARSPVTTRSNITGIVDLQDSGAIRLNIREILRIPLRLVLNVSVSRVGTSKEGPVAGTAQSISVVSLATGRRRVLLEEVLALVVGLQSVRGGVLSGIVAP